MSDSDEIGLIYEISIGINYFVLLMVSIWVAKRRVRKALLLCSLFIFLEAIVLATLAYVTESKILIGSAYMFGIISMYAVPIILKIVLVIQIAVWIGLKKMHLRKQNTYKE